MVELKTCLVILDIVFMFGFNLQHYYMLYFRHL